MDEGEGVGLARDRRDVLINPPRYAAVDLHELAPTVVDDHSIYQDLTAAYRRWGGWAALRRPPLHVLLVKLLDFLSERHIVNILDQIGVQMLYLLACAIHTPVLPASTPADAVPWLTDYPFESHFTEVSGGKMHYVDEGSGAPVVFVHGTPTWSYDWRAQLTALQDTNRVVAMDHIGFGLSDKPESWDYTPKAHADNLTTLLSRLELEDMTMVVHDFGGPIGLSYVLSHPEKVKNVVILNTWMWATADNPKAMRLSRLVAGPVGRYLYLKRNASARKLILWSMGDGFVAPDDFLVPYTHVLPDPEHRVGPWQLGVALGESSDWYGSLWEKVSVLADKNVTILWGDADPTFGEAELTRWKTALPNAQVVMLPGVGHFPQEEAPETVNQALLEILGAARPLGDGGGGAP